MPDELQADIQVWQTLPSSMLRMRLSVTPPDDPSSLAGVWLSDLVDRTQALTDRTAPRSTCFFTRHGDPALGRGSWVVNATDSHRSRMLASFAAWPGGSCGWHFDNPSTSNEGAIGQARASLHADDPDVTDVQCVVFCVDRSQKGVPIALEQAWLRIFTRVVSDFEVHYGEVEPNVDPYEDRTGWELRTGRLGNYRTMYMELGQRLRGFGWITWVPEQFVALLDLGRLRGPGGFHKVVEIPGKGLVLQATERSHEYTPQKAQELQDLLLPALEPEAAPGG